MNAAVRLYALPHSLYSGKVRAYLRYKRIPYQEVTATLRVYRSFIVPRTGVRYIPVIRTLDDVVVQDSTDIIDFLEQRYPQPSVYPATPRQRLVALLLELYGDEWLLLPAMHYRWSFPQESEHTREVLEQFGLLLSPHAPAWLRRAFGGRMCRPFRGALPRLGITPHTIPALEAWYEEFLDRMNAHFAVHPYLLGGRASIGDFGLMGPLYAHLGRDLYPKRLMQTRAPHVAAWVERMNSADQKPGDWLPDDAVPVTLLPVLQRLFAEHFPVLEDTARLLESWLAGHPREGIPRTIGWHRFRLGDAQEQRAVFPYAQWMLQRPIGFYRSLSGADQTHVDEWLRAAGGYEAMQIDIRRPVKRENNRLVAA